MPWEIQESDGKFCVHKKDTGEKLKCYPTKKEADDYMAALYANEPEDEKSIDPAAVKIGGRHSKADQDAIQEIHDRALFLGAQSPPPPKPDEVVSFPLGNYDKAMIYFGDAVKALGDGKVGGHLVRFSTDEDPDLTGDFFDKDTDYGDLSKADVYYQHGMDTKIGKRKIGKGTLKLDDVGVWIEAQLNMRDEYEKAIYALAEAGKLGWSSGTASHLVDREAKGKANYIKAWPLGLDASLTPTPAEPRNEAIPFKSYLDVIQPKPEAQAEAVGEAAPVDGGADKPKSIKENDMELTQEQLDAVVAQAGKAGADAAIKNLPTINAAGVQVTHDEADTPFKSIGEQLFAVKQTTLTQGRECDPRLKRLNVKATGMGELIGSEGGFLLEPSFVAEILKPLHDTGPFSSRAAHLPIGANSNGVTVRAVDETSRATGSRWGGIKGYRLAEGGTKVGSFPTFKLIELRLKKYAVLCYATDELLQDATALGGIIGQGAAEELDFMVNDDILNGAGVAGPLGILVSPALVTVAKEAGQLA
jgi:HK97 family phage major capsid protein